MTWIVLVVLVHIIVTNDVTALQLTTATVKDVQDAIQSGSCTCQQIIQGYLARIHAYNRVGPQIGGIISTNPYALRDAALLDEFYAKYRRLVGIIHCAPLIVKDHIDVSGLPSTNGVHLLRYMYPQMDATVVTNAKQAGAILIGKANMSPFSSQEAWGNSETGGLIRNPYGLSYTTYGSSGGNGASGAAMFTILGYGAETGVSINAPSSAANLVGLRPPVDLLKGLLDGALPNSKPQDVIGPMAKTVEDVTLLLDAEVGNSQTRRYSSPQVLRQDGLRGTKLNIFKQFTYDEFDIPGIGHYKVDPEILQLFNSMVDNMVKAGATVNNVTIDIAKAMENFMVMNSKADYDTCLAGWRNDYFGNIQRYGPTAPFHSLEDVARYANFLPPPFRDVWPHLANISSSSKCQEQLKFYDESRQKFINEVITPMLNNADVVFWPTFSVFPIKLMPEAFTRNLSAVSPPSLINFIQAGSWAGYPTLDLPLGFSRPLNDAPDGLPAGVILLAKPENLEKLLTIGYAYQKNYGVSKVPYSVPELPQNC